MMRSPDSTFPAGWCLSFEEEALLLGSRAERTVSQEERLACLIGACEPGSLWGIAALHQTAPQVARSLTISPLQSSFPSELTEQARAVRLQTAFYNLASHAELKQIGGRLGERGIPVVPLKGTHLAKRLYDGMDGRRVGDIDIIVPESHLEEARATLREMGYGTIDTEHGRDHPFHGAPFLRRGASHPFVVELHWKLSDPRFLTVDYGRFWERVLANRSAGPLSPLPAEESLVFLAHHMCKTPTGTLRLLADIDRLVRKEGPSMDWSSMMELAHSWSAAWQVYSALDRSRRLFGTSVPDWVLDRLRPPAWRRAIMELMVGPLAILRPPTSENLLDSEFMLGYSAMIGPIRRTLEAIHYFVFRTTRHEQRTLLSTALSLPGEAAHGAGYLAWAFGHRMLSLARSKHPLRSSDSALRLSNARLRQMSLAAGNAALRSTAR